MSSTVRPLTDTWNDLPEDLQRLVIQSALRDGKVEDESQHKFVKDLRLVHPRWAEMVCQCIQELWWSPYQKKDQSAYVMEASDFLLTLRGLKGLQVDIFTGGIKKDPDLSAHILQQLEKMTSLRSLHINHTMTSRQEVSSLEWIGKSKLTEFHVRLDSGVKNSELKELLQGLPHCLLNLSVDCVNCRIDAVEPYGLPTEQLTSLKLKGLHLDEEGLGGIIQTTPNVRNLTLADM